MRVVIASPEADAPAARALRQEQVPHEVILTEDDHAYGRLLERLWREHTGFVLLEWDIVPWPGAIRELWHCPLPFCQHRYAYAGELKMHMGCVKFSGLFTSKHRGIPFEQQWPQQHWSELAGHVTAWIANRVERPHEHWPAFAHCKAGD